MSHGPNRCQCGSTHFSRSYGGTLQCICGQRYTVEGLERVNGHTLIELCRYCNRSEAKVCGWWNKFVECLRCGARGPTVRTREQAIEAWNQQHAPIALKNVTEVREPYDPPRTTAVV